ncbi:MAG: hypothetical protein QG640_700 [Patescibacteria group bacterium]|nr:hypothetical protein [Patescibacteria group bacterium]
MTRNSESKDNSSEFSKFFRTASSGEKKKVFLDVAKKASEEQREVMRGVKFPK